MFRAILTLLTALSISAVAAGYSIIGLMTIFASAATAIMVMGIVLEIGKLVSASWLYYNWHTCPTLLKGYLTTAVAVLMFITSMGIFGFLSKAHIEQTSLSQEQAAQVTVIDEKILRSNSKIDRWQGEIDRLINTGSADTSSNVLAGDVQSLKDLRIQIKQEKDSVRKEASDRIKIAQDRRDKEIDSAKPLLDTWGGTDSYKEAVEEAKTKERKESGSARYVRDQRVKAIDKKYEPQIAKLNKLIDQARSGSVTKVKDVDSKIILLEANIEKEQTKIDVVREDKLVFEKQYRQLEAEVGPIKYVAEFIYGDVNQHILEKAVTWIILIIIFVFDPLAVLLLIAASISLNRRPERNTLPPVETPTVSAKPAPVKKK